MSVHERADLLQEIGAGIQLSPNATRILDRMGVLERLETKTVKPEAVILRKAATLSELARIPLGVAAEHRWGAPYLTVHRADLQAALLAEADEIESISLHFGHEVQEFSVETPTLTVKTSEGVFPVQADLVVAADGVWSTIRALGGPKGQSRFIGQLAWRRTIERGDAVDIDPRFGTDVVTAFLHPGFHLVAYPISGGRQLNLVAFTAYRRKIASDWIVRPDISVLAGAMQETAPALKRLVGDGDGWSA